MMSYDDIDVSLDVYGQTLRCCCCCCLRLNNVHHVGPVVDMSGPAIDLRGESVYEAATDDRTVRVWSIEACRSVSWPKDDRLAVGGGCDARNLPIHASDRYQSVGYSPVSRLYKSQSLIKLIVSVMDCSRRWRRKELWEVFGRYPIQRWYKIRRLYAKTVCRFGVILECECVSVAK